VRIFLISCDDFSEPCRIRAKSSDPEGPYGDAVSLGEEGRWHGLVIIEVPLPDGFTPGEKYKVIFEITRGGTVELVEGEYRYPHNDRTLFIGAGYHVDPVWWNTQRDYTEVGSRQGEGVNTFIELNRQYLELLRDNPQFACTFENVPAIHPTWLMDRGLRELIRKVAEEGRLELVGSYSEPQSTLVGCELMCRNIAYGMGFAEYFANFTPNGLAQWDVFGHDPVWPSLGCAAGLKWTTFCRGLYHGDHLEPEDNLFPSEFRWISPDGSEHFTHYMSRHYTSGWEFSWKSMADAEVPVLERFERLTRTSSTRNVLLPCYGDFAEPFEGMLEFAREWNESYVSPKIRFGTQDDYVRAVLEDAEKEGVRFLPISRDMNPAFSGCNLSYIDTKIAQRKGECKLRSAEMWATFASLYGAKYPTSALDRAWRILCYNSHHDAVTGSESDQVYLDLNALWREAYDIARRVSLTSRDALSMLTEAPVGGDGSVVTVFNSLGWDVTSPVFINKDEITEGDPDSVIDEGGQATPVEKVKGGLRFIAGKVPSVGWKNYRLTTSKRLETVAGPGEPDTIENDFFRLKVDAECGGGIASIRSIESGKEFIREGKSANDVVVYPEYPGMNMAPWLIQTTGERLFSSNREAVVTRTIGRGVQSITSRLNFFNCEIEKTVTLWYGLSFIDCKTSVRGYADRDHMWRAEFPVGLKNLRPVAQTSGGVIGRPYGRLGDYQEQRYIGTWPVDMWGGLESVLLFELNHEGRKIKRNVAVGEIVIPDDVDENTLNQLDRLVKLLAVAGVTTVVTRAGGRRSGDWLKDGSRPDFRISMGVENPYKTRLFKLCGLNGNETWVDAALDETGYDLPVIILPDDAGKAGQVLDKWEGEIKAGTGTLTIDGPSYISAEVEKSGSYGKPDGGVAVLVRGTPDMLVLEDGTLSLGLFRSPSAPPSGGWVDGIPVRMPDESFFSHGHWTHNFEYRLMPHEEGWREAGVYERALEFNHPLEASIMKHEGGPLPSTAGFLPLNRTDIFIQAIRPIEMPEHTFDHGTDGIDVESGILLRLREIKGTSGRLDAVELNTDEFREVDLLGRETETSKALKSTRVGPWSISSLRARLNIINEKPSREVSLDSFIEPWELIPARYWRSGLGPCGWNALPVFHRFREEYIDIGVGGTSSAILEVTNNTKRKINGIEIEFNIPEGLTISGDSVVSLNPAPGETKEFEVRLGASIEDIHRGGYLNAILSLDGMRTVASLPINRDPDIPAPVFILPPEAVILGKDRSELRVEIRNLINQEVEGILELIVPFDIRGIVESNRARKRLTLPSGDSTEDVFSLGGRESLSPGEYYGVLKWHSCEEQAYSISFRIVVPDENGTWISAEQGKHIQFDFPFAGAVFNVFSENDSPVGINIESGGELPNEETIHERMEVEGGYLSTFYMRIPSKRLMEPRDLPLHVSFREGDTEREFKTTLVMPKGPRLSAVLVEESLQVDDSPSEWESVLEKQDIEFSFMSEPDAGSEEKALLPVWIGFDLENLYFKVDVPWYSPENRHEKRGITKGDSLQLAFFPSRIAELGYAYLKDKGPYSWTFYEIMNAPRPESPPVAIEREREVTSYRTVIPWRFIFLDSLPGMLPVNILIHTTGRDGRWKGAWAISEGTLVRKTSDGSEFGLILFKHGMRDQD